ncbi:MAG TPA: hypothetical protein VGO47_11460 [Chlamydiales bacterium]|nr:hypothetical protein [Chlamydiales bacterium]
MIVIPEAGPEPKVTFFGRWVTAIQRYSEIVSRNEAEFFEGLASLAILAVFSSREHGIFEEVAGKYLT